MSHHQFHVTGLSCGHCVAAIEKALQELDPDARVQVELTRGQVMVDSERSRDVLGAAITDAGYAVQ